MDCDNVSSEILIVLLDFVSRRELVGDMVVGRFPINWRGLYYDSAGVRVADCLRRGEGYRVWTWWRWRGWVALRAQFHPGAIRTQFRGDRSLSSIIASILPSEQMGTSTSRE